MTATLVRDDKNYVYLLAKKRKGYAVFGISHLERPSPTFYGTYKLVTQEQLDNNEYVEMEEGFSIEFLRENKNSTRKLKISKSLRRLKVTTWL